MPIDSSLYGNEMPNPLAQAGQALSLANQAQQNRLLQTQNEAAQVGLNSAKFELGLKKMQTMNDYMVSRYGQKDENGNPTVTQDDLIDDIKHMTQNHPDMYSASDAVKDIMEVRSGPSDPREINKKLEQVLNFTLPAVERANAVRGQITNISTGQGKRAVMQTASGYRDPTTGAPISSFPESVQTVGPGGQPVNQLMNNAGGGGNPLTGGSGSPAENILQRNGGIPITNGQGQQPVMANGQPAPASLASNQYPAVPTGLAPGVKETMEANAGQGVVLQRTADSVPQRKALLGELEGTLDGFNSGPGAEKFKNAVAGINRALGTSVDTKGVASSEVFNKLATHLAQQQFTALGGTGTDSKLDSAMHTSPSTALSKMGNKEIIALLKGNEDAIKVKNQEWQQWKQQYGPGSYDAFSNEFNKNFDPRVFQAKYMSPEARKDMLKGMTSGERDQFKQIYNQSHVHGWVQ